MDSKITLSKNLNEIFKKRGLSISVSAKKMGVNRNTLENYCNGVLPKGLLTITKIADFLGITVSDLIFGYEQTGEGTNASPIVGKYELTIRQVDDLSTGEGNK